MMDEFCYFPFLMLVWKWSEYFTLISTIITDVFFTKWRESVHYSKMTFSIL